jgi:hypothetical protein
MEDSPGRQHGRPLIKHIQVWSVHKYNLFGVPPVLINLHRLFFGVIPSDWRTQRATNLFPIFKKPFAKLGMRQNNTASWRAADQNRKMPKVTE